jgi:hypothetical protein
MASLNQLHEELKDLAEKYFWSFYPAMAEDGLELMKQRRSQKNNKPEGKNARKAAKTDKAAKRGRGRPVGTGNKQIKKNPNSKSVVSTSNRGRRSKSK